MKKRIIISIMSILAVIGAGMLFYFGLELLGSSSILAMSVGVVEKDTLTVQKVKADSTIDEDYVSQQITKMKPASTPLDTIMRSAGKKVKIDSFKTEFYAVDTRALTDTVASAYTNNGNDKSAAITVDNDSIWSVDDTVLAKGVAGTSGTGDCEFIVLDINASTHTLTLQPFNGVGGGDDELPNLPEDTVLIRGGQSKFETDATTTPFAILPAKDYNYTQLFMAQVEQSIYQRMHGKEVQWNFSDMEALNIYDMRATMEISFLWGVRKKITEIGTLEDKYSTGGVSRSIVKGLEYGTGGSDRTVTKGQLIDWTKEIFSGNSGSDMRLLFVGNTLGASLMKIDDVTRQLNAGTTEVKWGIRFRKIESNFGTLYVKHHPLFDLVGENDNGLVLDLNNVEKHIFLPTQIETLNLRKPGLKKADATVISETSCLVLRYPATHAKITPKA